MGIKFHCPNGHKLNVKAFLAGKRGVCPKCGTKVRIPTESEPGLDSDLDEEEAGGSAISKHNGSGAAVAQAATAPAGVATAAAPSAAPAKALDPIDENPAAIWYVRPFTGGQYGQQYGPAKGDIMRKWLTEGRVSNDSLVWREGWTDWQTAAKAFPELESGAAPPPTPAPAPSTTVPLSPKSSTRAAARYDSKKQSTSSLAIAILVGLGILSLILAGVLVYFVMNLK